MPIHNQSKSAKDPQEALNCDALHQACVIDHHGKEVPITQEMINKSCNELSQKEHAQTPKNDLNH